MSKKKQLSLLRTLLTLASNQSGHIGFGRRFPLMSPDDGGGNGGGGDGGDPNKNADGSYKPEFVEKLLKEKNNHRDAKLKLEEELKALKGAPPKKDDQNQGGDDKTKELLKLKDEEYKKTKERLDALEKERTDGIKLGALREEFEKNGGDPKKFSLIQRLADTSKIMIDEDSGVVYGTEREIQGIKAAAPELFGKPKKGVNDGATDHNDQHDQDQGGDDAFKKGLEGSRLKKSKEGTNPFAALYAAKGMKVTATKS